MTLAPQSVRNNLVEDLTGVDAFSHDTISAAAITGYAPWSRPYAEGLGQLVWAPATLAAARNAHRYPPELRTPDRLGNRIDVVDFHPSYHELMSMAFGHGVHALSWTADQPGAHLARAVQSYLWNQVDGATACPTGMAYAAVPTRLDFAVGSAGLIRAALSQALHYGDHRRAFGREAPLNAIWEGTSNMMVLDVQRVLTREPKAIEPLLDEVRAAAGAEPLLSQAVARSTSSRTVLTCTEGQHEVSQDLIGDLLVQRPHGGQ